MSTTTGRPLTRIPQLTQPLTTPTRAPHHQRLAQQESATPATPSPPRVRHADGMTRYEKEVARGGGPHAKGGEDVKMVGSWRLGKVIGTGASGRVRIARHVVTGQYAAVKIIPRSLITATASRMSLADANLKAEKARMTLEREIVIMKLIDHPNVMSLWDVHEIDGTLYLILEYVAGGELFDYLVSVGRLQTDEAAFYFQQIIAGLDYCHRFNICHRDLKPENLLLDKQKNIKIADFGMAALNLGSMGDGMLRTSCGSPHYASPEIVSGMEYDGKASDIWSCGVILYALLMNRLPFDDEDMGMLLYKVRMGKYELPEDTPVDARDLIGRMLCVDPNKRITMPEIRAHPFFQRRGFIPQGQDRAPPIVEPPRIEEIARPVKSEPEIDPDILKSLCALWPGSPESEIVDALLSSEKRWEKAFYYLLVKHKMKRLENYDDGSGGGTLSMPSDRVNRRASVTVTSRTKPSTAPDRQRSQRNSMQPTVGQISMGPPDLPGRLQPRQPSRPTSPTPTKATATASILERPRYTKAAGPRPRSSVTSNAASAVGFQVLQDKDLTDKYWPAGSDASKHDPSSTSRRSQSPAFATTRVEPEVKRDIPSIKVVKPPQGRASQNVQGAQDGWGGHAPLVADAGLAGLLADDDDPALRSFIAAVNQQILEYKMHGKPLGLPSTTAQADEEKSLGNRQISTSRFMDAEDSTPYQLGIPSGLGHSFSSDDMVLVMKEDEVSPSRATTEHVRGHTRCSDVDGHADCEATPTRPSTIKRVPFGDAATKSNASANAHKRQPSQVLKQRPAPPPPRPVPVPPPVPLEQPKTERRKSRSIPTEGIEYLTTPTRHVSDSTNVSSLFSTRSSKHGWFGSLFNWKPAAITLISLDNTNATTTECFKLLDQMGVKITLENWGVFRCKVDHLRSNDGIVFLKPLRFRVEISAVKTTKGRRLSFDYSDPLMPLANSSGTEPPSKIVLTQEKGALSTLEAVHTRLVTEWRLSSLHAPSTPPQLH